MATQDTSTPGPSARRKYLPGNFIIVRSSGWTAFKRVSPAPIASSDESESSGEESAEDDEDEIEGDEGTYDHDGIGHPKGDKGTDDHSKHKEKTTDHGKRKEGTNDHGKHKEGTSDHDKHEEGTNDLDEELSESEFYPGTCLRRYPWDRPEKPLKSRKRKGSPHPKDLHKGKKQSAVGSRPKPNKGKVAPRDMVIGSSKTDPEDVHKAKKGKAVAAASNDSEGEESSPEQEPRFVRETYTEEKDMMIRFLRDDVELNWPDVTKLYVEYWNHPTTARRLSRRYQTIVPKEQRPTKKVGRLSVGNKSAGVAGGAKRYPWMETWEKTGKLK
ncbi:hypothetical protein FN846DRAFT_902528 [Sphaerosporella brunnea]|uniref:Uncharacterized protein n=1 Tax=Sphaerosporella brunnea TaxID=1250544 RepID=A0A5J5F9I7_9PEZI|nr:hypothetical protein FN846DRAFT_902528 [Sphaerosporella brunnea]